MQGLWQWNRANGLRAVVAVGVTLLVACAPQGEALYARAEEALAQGQSRAAVIDLQNLAKAEPGNARVRALLARALVESGDREAGAIELKKAQDLGAPAEMIIGLECRLLLEDGEFDKVLAVCRPEAAPAAARAEIEVAQARALLGLDRVKEARSGFEKIIGARPDNVAALTGLADAAMASEGLPAAKAVMAKASDAAKLSAEYWMHLGAIEAAGGDWPTAEKAYAEALARADAGDDVTARLLALGALAESQMRQGKVQEASANGDKLLKLAPGVPLVKQLRGQVAAAAGDLDQARVLLEAAVAEMPESPDARLLLGAVHLQQGNLGQAEMNIRAVLTQQPGNVKAHKLLAETLALAQSPKQSLASLKPVLGSDADPSMLALAGRLSLASGDREQGLGYLAQASSQAGSQQAPGVQVEVATSYLLAGAPEQAIEVLEAVPENATKRHQRDFLLILANLRKGDTGKAVEGADALVARAGDEVTVRQFAAGIYSTAGRPEAARTQLEEALRIAPGDQQVLLNLARLHLSQGELGKADASVRKILESDPKSLPGELGAALVAQAKGDLAEAERWARNAVEDHPDSLDARVALAEQYLARRDFGKARSVVDDALARFRASAVLSNLQGRARLGLNDVPGAVSSFRQATAQAPKMYAYTLNLARAHMLNRDLNGALEVLNALLAADPSFVPALALAADSCLVGGQVEKAAGYVERLRKVAPGAVVTNALQGELAMAQRRYSDALADYRRASAVGQRRELVIGQYRAGRLAGLPNPERPLEDWVAANPDDMAMVAMLAEAVQQRGDADRAISLYERSLAKSPNNAAILNNLALLYQAKGDGRALQLAERAYKSAPDSGAIQDTYGWLLLGDGQVDKAVGLLARATRAMPDNAEVQYHYGVALAQAGRSSEAVDYLKKALRHNLPADAKSDSEELLRKLTQN